MPNRIHMGFVIPGDGNWSGGINYLRNVFMAIRSELDARVTVRLFISPDQRQMAQQTFAPLLEVPPIIDNRVAGAGNGKRAFGAVLTGRDKALADLVMETEIDVMFETARFYGRRFPVPVLSWIPDFQHQHLPHLFNHFSWWKREMGFRAQCSGSRVILLSSLTARADCERFYPTTRGRTCVARFVTSVPLSEISKRAETICEDYNLPKRYFFLPNQFWEHKNHDLVVEALIQIHRRGGGLANFPPVVMSGSQANPRNPMLFNNVMKKAVDFGLAAHFRHLGHIPYIDVLALNMASLAVLNPSQFEGWATSVEEAKAMLSPLIISDIPVHREQAPAAHFFDPDDASALAAILEEAATGSTARILDTDSNPAPGGLEQKVFAAEFMAAIQAAYANSQNNSLQ